MESFQFDYRFELEHLLRPHLGMTLFILLVLVGYRGIDVSPTFVPQWSTLLFLLIFIMYKNITLNAIYYYSHNFSLIFLLRIMYTVWCLTLYHYSIYCWTLSIYNCSNLIAIPFYHNHTLLSYIYTSRPCRFIIVLTNSAINQPLKLILL